MSLPYFFQITTLAAINALITLGLYPAVATGQLSVAHAALAGVGGYAAGLVSINTGLPLAVAVVVGGAAASVTAAIVSAVVSRLHGLYLAIATLAMGEALVVVSNNLEVLGGARGLS